METVPLSRTADEDRSKCLFFLAASTSSLPPVAGALSPETRVKLLLFFFLHQKAFWIRSGGLQMLNS